MNLQGAEPELSALCNDDEIYERKFSIRSFASKSNKFCFCFSPSACLSTRSARKNFALGAPLGVYMVLVTSMYFQFAQLSRSKVIEVPVEVKDEISNLALYMYR